MNLVPGTSQLQSFFFSNTQESSVSLYIKKKKKGYKTTKPKQQQQHTPHLTQKKHCSPITKKDLTSTKKESPSLHLALERGDEKFL
jgi:predicted DNA-binding WGR domain protein